MKLLVCGSRKEKVRISAEEYRDRVHKELDKYKAEQYNIPEIIEGCCLDSADQYAEEWCNLRGIKCIHFPGNPGNYLKRNIEMVEACDEVYAFWDGFSYGTCFTIAQAVLNNKRVKVFKI